MLKRRPGHSATDFDLEVWAIKETKDSPWTIVEMTPYEVKEKVATEAIYKAVRLGRFE